MKNTMMMIFLIILSTGAYSAEIYCDQLIGKMGLNIVAIKVSFKDNMEKASAVIKDKSGNWYPYHPTNKLFSLESEIPGSHVDLYLLGDCIADEKLIQYGLIVDYIYNEVRIVSDEITNILQCSPREDSILKRLNYAIVGECQIR